MTNAKGAALAVKNEDRLRTISINRPESLNSLNGEVRDQLLSALRYAASDDTVGAVLLTGSGRAFCAGADLQEFQVNFSPDDPEQIVGFIRQAMIDGFNPLVTEITDMPKPVVAAVGGVCAGGGIGLALACDIVVCDDRASFHMPFVKQLGIIPDMGATWLLPHIIGRQRSLAWSLTGEAVDAHTALSWGLVSKIFGAEEFADEATALGKSVSRLHGPAVRELKRAVQLAQNQSLAAQLHHERIVQGELTASQVFADKVSGFLSKSKPKS